MHAKRATLAIHGIWTKSRDIGWINIFEHEARHELDVRPRVYGWLSGALTYFSWYRTQIVGFEASYIKKLLIDEPRPNVIAHSFGGYVAWALMAARGVNFHNVILLAPAAPAETPWNLFDHLFRRARVYYSPRDEIIGLAAYGRMGKVGPAYSHPRVEPIETNLLHSDHVHVSRMKEYVEFLRQEVA